MTDKIKELEKRVKALEDAVFINIKFQSPIKISFGKGAEK